jgi:hypothetical protein
MEQKGSARTPARDTQGLSETCDGFGYYWPVARTRSVYKARQRHPSSAVSPRTAADMFQNKPRITRTESENRMSPASQHLPRSLSLSLSTHDYRKKQYYNQCGRRALSIRQLSNFGLSSYGKVSPPSHPSIRREERDAQKDKEEDDKETDTRKKRRGRANHTAILR